MEFVPKTMGSRYMQGVRGKEGPPGNTGAEVGCHS